MGRPASGFGVGRLGASATRAHDGARRAAGPPVCLLQLASGVARGAQIWPGRARRGDCFSRSNNCVSAEDNLMIRLLNSYATDTKLKAKVERYF